LEFKIIFEEEKERLIMSNNKTEMTEKKSDLNDFTNDYYGLIYKITNKHNGKVYIGKTIQTLRRRWQQHQTDAKLKRKKTLLVFALNKYRINNFKIEKIVGAHNKKSLNELEMKYIEQYRSNAFRYSNPAFGYNMTDGGEVFKILKGEEHPNYTEIDIDALIDLIRKGYTISEIASELKVGNTVIFNRINEMGFNSIHDAREAFGSQNIYQLKRSARMSKAAKEREIKEETKDLMSNLKKGSGNPNYKIIEREKLVNSIKKNRRINLEDIGRELEISKNTAMVKVRELLHMSFQEAKKVFYFKPILKHLIKNGKTVKDINKIMGYKNQGRINEKIRELWDLSFRQARRLFRVYPRIDKTLLESLMVEEYSTKDIDRVFMTNLVLSFTMSDITKLLEINEDTLYRRIKDILGFDNLRDARVNLGGQEIIEFFEKIRKSKISKSKRKYPFTKELILNLISKGLDLKQISDEIRCSKRSVQYNIKQILNTNYSKARDKFYWKPTFKSFILRGFSKLQIVNEINSDLRKVNFIMRRLYGTVSIVKLRKLMRFD
jgi:AraC-like DNA-binding protein